MSRSGDFACALIEVTKAYRERVLRSDCPSEREVSATGFVGIGSLKLSATCNFTLG